MSRGPLDGQVAIVTGGGAGIGEATTRKLAEAGADVAILARKLEPARKVAAEIEALGRRALVVEIELAQTDRIPAAVAEVLAAFGRIDILVNNAAAVGLPAPTSILEMSEETWDNVYDVNVKAAFLLMQQVARHMVERGGGGRIVNVTSSSAYRARTWPAYGSSKAALSHLTRIAAAELGPHGITVNNVAPGITRTPIAIATHGNEAMDRAVVEEGTRKNLLGRVAEPEDVAAAIVFLCLPEALQITAETIHTSAMGL